MTDQALEVDPVTWQVAWWALVPLAMSAMTQPCGAILDRHSRNHRFYARASPIICVGDIFYFILILLVGFIAEPSRAKANARYELYRRFKHEQISRGSTSIDGSTVMRLFLLALGGIPCQTVKIFSMKGIPWTKAWALMYFISIIFGEVLIFVAKRVDSWNIPSSTPKWRQELSNFRFPGLLNAISSIPIIVQISAIMWIWAKFASPWIKIGVENGPAFFFNPITYILGTCLAMAFSWLKIIRDKKLFESFYDGDNFDYTTQAHTEVKIVAWTTCAVFLACTLASYLTLSATGPLSVLDLFMVLGSLNSLDGLIISLRFRFVSRTFRVDDELGIQAVFSFFWVFCLSLAYYGTMFDSANTENPNWTGVFD